MTEVIVTADKLNVDIIYKKVCAPTAGAVNLFVGTVRNKTKEKQVVRLEYEAYNKMAISEIEKIVNNAKKKWSIENVIVHHRSGVLDIGDEAVVIAVSTPHRKESFEACEFIIDSLKQTVPIWKKEVFSDGEVWVAAHP